MMIDGKKLAQEIILGFKKLPKPEKILAAVLIGSAGSPKMAQSLSFLRKKEKIAGELGIVYRLYQFDNSILEEDLIKEIKKLSNDKKIGGIIVQLPLPTHYRRDKVLAAINPQKDIDALTPESRKFVLPLPVEVVKDVLDSIGEDIAKKNVAVVGRGFLVGKPIIEWLKQCAESESFARPDLRSKSGLGLNVKCKKLILLNSKTGLNGIGEADLIITGVGKGGLIKPKMLNKNAGVIDFGYDVVGGKIKGDFEPREDFSGWYTPTPGGTGPILVAEIFKNFYKLNNLFC